MPSTGSCCSLPSFPGIGYLITAGVVRLLKVDRETMKQIQSNLEKRRTNYRELNDYQELKAAETK